MLNVSAQTFQEEVLQSDIPVLVDFWAPWCGPCRMFTPIVEDFAASCEGKVKVVKVNIDEEPSLAERYGVMSIPTVMLFENGQVQESRIGVIGQEELAALTGLRG